MPKSAILTSPGLLTNAAHDGDKSRLTDLVEVPFDLFGQLTGQKTKMVGRTASNFAGGYGVPARNGRSIRAAGLQAKYDRPGCTAIIAIRYAFATRGRGGSCCRCGTPIMLDERTQCDSRRSHGEGTPEDATERAGFAGR